jgi:hypothetical protein
MNHHQYYLNTSSVYLMSTETNNPYINKAHLPNYLSVRQKIGNIDAGGISLEIGGILSSTYVYDREGMGLSLFDYVCYDQPRMKVMLY